MRPSIGGQAGWYVVPNKWQTDHFRGSDPLWAIHVGVAFFFACRSDVAFIDFPNFSKKKMPRSRPKIDSKVTQKQVKKESKSDPKSCFFYVSAKILCKERRSRRFGKIKQMENVWSGLASAVLIPDSLSMGVKKFEKNGPKTSSKVSSKLVKVAFIFSFILSRFRGPWHLFLGRGMCSGELQDGLGPSSR